MEKNGFSVLRGDEDGKRELLDEPLQRKHTTNQKHAAPDKIYPVNGLSDTKKIAGNAKDGFKTDTRQQKGVSNPPLDVKRVFLQILIGISVCICLNWTVWLILLNVAPNDMVNRVMNTGNLDNGSFWLMIDSSRMLVGFATFGLSIIAIGYFAILVKMLWSSDNSKMVLLGTLKAWLIKMGNILNDAADARRSSCVMSAVSKLAALAKEGSASRKRVRLIMKFGDLGLETLLLYQMLESGSPTSVIVVFTVIVASNALACAAMMFIPIEKAPLAETFVDILFDFLIIVGCPMLVLLYCLSNFTFDRAKLALNVEVFPAGWFEQMASVIANAEQTAVIYASLKSLRIMSPLDFFTRLGVNATLCFRLWNVVDSIRNPTKQKYSIYPKRHRIGAALLFCFSLVLILFVEESLRTSTLACKPHPECVVNARRWITDTKSLTRCPCIMLIDRDTAPKTYAEWENPINITDKVAQLASMGDLQTIKLTNRYLAILPDELRGCKKLRHLSLEYTHTQTLPMWFKEFTHLEFLHLESKFTSSVVVLPDDIFDDMSSLTFIHFAGFISMVKLPSFDGLTNLKSLTIAVFIALEEVPRFDSLENLERLVLAILPTISGLPDFSSIKDLKSFAASSRGAWCCNGFLGTCDLQDFRCGVEPQWRNPAVICLASDRTENVATAATLAAVQKFDATTCGPDIQPNVLEGPPTPELMTPCNGTLYRQCERPDGVEAMCYNARYMGIACTTNSFPIEMRRRQIARGIGDRCNPEFEAWLGCK